MSFSPLAPPKPKGWRPAIRMRAVATKDGVSVTLSVPTEILAAAGAAKDKRDSEKADSLTLHPHKEREFWLWVASWALFLSKPSDLGFSDQGYDRPPLDIRWYEVPTDHSRAGAERDGQARLFKNAALGVVEAAREKRESLGARIARLMQLRAEDPAAHRIIWHDLEAERHAIEKAIPTVGSIYGAQKLEENERVALDFKHGRLAELATKPEMSGAGCNFQKHCHWAVFLGIGFKFRDFIQAVHRLDRFGQTKTVRLDLIYTEAERDIRRRLERRWRQHREQAARMAEIIREFGLAQAAISQTLQRSIGVARQEFSVPAPCPLPQAGEGGAARAAPREGEPWAAKLVNADAVEETMALPSNSVDLIVTSIPFSTQYEYTPSYNDFGHSDSDAEFWAQMDFLTPELLRVLEPGRICAVHVKDRIVPGGLSGLGFQTLNPFSDDCVAHFRRHGFAYLGRKTIVTDVVRENNQTYRLGWTEQCKDGSRMGCGLPEYLLIFRKPPSDNSSGYADIPVVKAKPLCDDHGEAGPFDPRRNWKRPVPGTGYSRARWQMDAHGFMRSSGDRLLSSTEIMSLPHKQLYRLWRDRSTPVVYDFEAHVGIAEEMDHAERLPSTFMQFPPHSWHPDVWTDIARMRSLNTVQAAKGKEQHLCPLPFDIVTRAIGQYSMPGEIVFDPFAGLGTVPYCAMKLGRKGLGVELSAAYFRDACFHLDQLAKALAVPSLFELLEIEDEAAAAAEEAP